MLKYLVIIIGWMVTVLPANALEKLAIVIGNGSYSNFKLDEPARNAIIVSQSLLGLGFEVVRLENANAVDHPLGNRSADTVLLFFSGIIAVEGNQTRLLSVNLENLDKPSGWVLDELVKSYQKAGAKRVLVFLDTCHTDAGGAGRQQALALDIQNVFQAQTTDPGKMCPAERTAGPSFTTTLIEALLIPNEILSDVLSDKENIWVRSWLSDPFIVRTQNKPGKELSASDLKMLDRLSEQDRKRMLDLWRRAGIIKGKPSTSASSMVIATVKNDTIILTDSVQPVVTSAILSPVTNFSGGQTLPQARNTVRIFTASADPAKQFQPTAAGLPTPSIIVGNIKPGDSFSNPTELGAAISGTEMGTLDYNARQKMRADNPDLFDRLLAGGAFDPPANALAGAIQTELSRMGCYSSRIDGIWGSGSRAAVNRYFAQIGNPPPSREPVIAVFRQLLRKDDVICPKPQTVATSTRRSSSGSTRPRQSTARTPPKPATRTPPKPAAPTAPRTINRTLSPAGVFR